MNKMHKVFISYSSADSETVDIIDSDLKSLGISLIRDIRDLKYTSNIYSFMSRVREADYVIVILSESFLRSKFCMIEMMDLFKDEGSINKLLPIIIDNKSISDVGKSIEIVDYWNAKKSQLEIKIKQNEIAGKSFAIEELENVNTIALAVGKFIKSINKIKYIDFKSLKLNNYSDLLEQLGIENNHILSELIKIDKIKDEAKKYILIDEYLVKYPKNKHVYFYKAYFEDDKKNYKQAMYYYKKVLEIDKFDLEAGYNLSVLEYKVFGNHFDAYSRLKLLSALYKSAKVHHTLGHLLSAYMGNFEEALHHFQKTIELDPNNAMANYNCALSLQNLKDYKNALKYYKKAISLRPNYIDAYINIATILESMRDFKGSKKYYKKALEIKESDCHIHYNLGVMLSLYGEDYFEAKKHFLRAIEINPFFAEAYLNLGLVCFQFLHEFGEAKKYFRKAVDLQPKYVEIIKTIFNNPSIKKSGTYYGLNIKDYLGIDD
ncbi:tetratricopeptide repeat protein [Candidatus Omnitrophota bacterium]